MSPAKACVHRRPSITHGRIVHLLSDLELAVFLLFDWMPDVIDIREQFPLDPEKTLTLSKRIGIKHPAAKGTLQVMSTDLLVDFNRGGQIISQAVSVKYRDDLEDPRVVEKQELERRYWEGLAIEWFLFTEHEIPLTLIQNIKWLIPHLYNYEPDKSAQSSTFSRVLKAIETFPENKVAIVMKQLDEQQSEKAGTHLQYLRHLLAQGAFTWDMSAINHRSLRTGQLLPSEYWLNEDNEYVYAQ